MAVTGVTTQPEVVKLGGAVENRQTYTSNDTLVKGDLIRITTSGTIKLAKLDSDTEGAVHGIVEQAHAAATDIACPVLLFAPDTVVRLQCEDSVAPEDIRKVLPKIVKPQRLSDAGGIPDSLKITRPGYPSADRRGMERLIQGAGQGK